MYIYIYVYICTCKYVYTDIHTYMYICVYIYILAQLLGIWSGNLMKLLNKMVHGYHNRLTFPQKKWENHPFSFDDGI